MLAAIVILLLIFALVGVLGFVIKGLFWLFIAGLVLFVITLLSSIFGGGHRLGRRSKQS